MAMITNVPWSGLGFAPFPTPDWPVAGLERGSLFVTEWSTGAHQDESRSSSRCPCQREILLTDLGWWESENPLPVRGACLNRSDNGLYAIVPDGYGLAVGQQYRFQLGAAPQEGIELTQMGVIVRTERLYYEGSEQIGIGVRLSGASSA